MMSMSKQVVGSILVFIGAVMFGGKAVIVKWLYLNTDIDTLAMLSLRMLFSVPFYIAILYWEKTKGSFGKVMLTQQDWLYLFGIGLVGYYLASLFDFLGLKYISASIERLVLFIYPTLVVLLSSIFWKKKITSTQVFALVITYLGIIVAFVPDMQLGMSRNFVLGVILIFLSALTYALYLIGNGQLVQKIGTNLATCYAMIISSIFIIGHNAIFGSQSIFHFEAKIYLWSIVMAVFCTVIPSFLVTAGIKRIGSSNAAIIGAVGPMATIFMAVYFLNEQFNGWQIFGSVLILIGVLFISVKK